MALQPRPFCKGKGEGWAVERYAYTPQELDAPPKVLALHCRIVTVEHRVPGGEKPQDCDYYWSMWHDRQHNTFIDSFTDEPLSKALHAKNDGPRVCPDSYHASSRCTSDMSNQYDSKFCTIASGTPS